MTKKYINPYNKTTEFYMSRMGQHFTNRMQAKRSLQLYRQPLLFARVAVYPLKNRNCSARHKIFSIYPALRLSPCTGLLKFSPFRTFVNKYCLLKKVYLTRYKKITEFYMSRNGQHLTNRM